MRHDNIKRMSYGTQTVKRIVCNDKIVYSHPRTFRVLAKPYPQDSQAPLASLSEDGVYLSNTFPRSWCFFVWDRTIAQWRTDLNYFGARYVNTENQLPTPRYDTWDSAVRVAQQQAFCDAIDDLPDGLDIVIAGSHAAEHYGANMVTRLKRCGASDAMTKWTTRSNYILVGRTGIGEGNGYQEVLDNATYNGVSNCAEVYVTY